MKLYFEAENFLIGSEKGLKSRIFNAKLTNDPKHVYALVISTLKYKEYILTIIKKSKLEQDPTIKKLKVKEPVLILLVHDYLFSSKRRNTKTVFSTQRLYFIQGAMTNLAPLFIRRRR